MGEDDVPGAALIERAVLNDSEIGREITSAFVRAFGDFMATFVRPALVDLAAAGGEPQLLVNGLAELLRTTADRIEFPLDHPRAGSPAARWLDDVDGVVTVDMHGVGDGNPV